MDPDVRLPAFRGALVGAALALDPPDDALARLLGAVHPDDRGLVEAARADARAGDALDVEYRVLDADGAVRWVLERLRPGEGGAVAVDGELLGTDDGEADDLRALLGALDEALYAIDVLPDGEMAARWLGPAWDRLLGAAVPDAAWALEAWVAAVHPDDVPVFLARSADLLAGRPVRVAYRLSGLDGAVRWVSERAKPRPRPGGGVRVDGIVVDVTDERRLREGLAEAQERLQSVLAGVDELVYTLQLLPDGGLHVVVRSPSPERVTGLAGDAGVLALWGEAVHADDRPLVTRALGAARAGLGWDAELRVIGEDGRERWIWHRIRPRTDRVGRRLVDGVASDVSARREEREELDAARRRLDAVLGAIDEVLLSVEVRGGGRLAPAFVGPGLERLLRGPLPARADAVGIWQAAIHSDDRGRFEAALADLRAGRSVDMDYRVVCLDSTTRWVQWRARPRHLPDGRLIVDGVLADATERRRRALALERELDAADWAARHDGLTGLANRREAREAIAHALAGRREAIGLLMLDVDRFKSVNDTHGHHVGDQVLVEVAQRLGGTVRARDLVARWGGEEFCVLLEHVRDDVALRRVAEALRAVLAATPFPTDAGPLPVTASFGAARAAPDDDVDALVAAADRALYAAKDAGRNRVVVAGDVAGLDAA